MLSNYQSMYRVSPLSSLVLLLALVQGTSTSLSLVYHFLPAAELLVNIVWMATYLLAGVGLFASYGVNWITWLVRYRLLLVLLLLGVVLSITWSENTELTAERSVHLVGSTLIAFFIGFTIPLTRIISVSAYAFTALMAASAAFAIFLPEYGTEDYNGVAAWRGIMAAKNTLGFWASVTCMLTISMILRSVSLFAKALWFCALTLAFVCLSYSISATSVLALTVAVVIVAGLYTAHRFQLGLIATLALAVLAFGVIVVLFQQIDTAELIGRSGDLTGRTDVWSQTWQLILSKPLTGYGYGTLWYPTADTLYIQRSLLDFTWVVHHAHNGFLHVASELGIPIAIIGLLMVLQQMIEVLYCQYQRQQSGTLFLIAFSFALLISNYSEARFLVNREMYWIFFIAMPISMLQQVSVVLRDDKLNPITAALLKTQREKSIERVADRSRKRVLKTRLKNARSINPEAQPDARPGRVIDGQVTQRNTTA